jgi:NADPH:quinone reductase-like Zn-dependent oxidoreductase
MKAIVQRGYGGSEVLRYEDVEVPKVGPRDVLVRVRAASINHGDLAVIAGSPYVVRLAFGLRRPRVTIRGRDVAGVVEEVGDEVARFRPGDEVFAETPTGTWAECTVVPARLLARKPSELTFEQAAAIPVAGVTALQALRDVAEVRAGDKVLINGASGGVGTFAVQIARSFGAEVTGVCSTRNLDLVRSLGAGRVVDHTMGDAFVGGQRYDVVLDLAGGRPLALLRRAVTPKGTLVLVSGEGGRVFGPLGRYVRAMMLHAVVRQRLRVHAAKPRPEDLDELAGLVCTGAIRPAIEATASLSETTEVVRRLQTAHARAKNVLVP